MKSVYRFVFDHTGLCKTVLFLGLTWFTFSMINQEYVSFLTVYLVDLAVWFIGTRFIAMAPEKLLQEPLHILEQQCDPFPLLEEISRQMSRRQSGLREQSTQVNYAMALRMTGENQKTAEVLEGINIDRYPGASPYFKFIYYNNLADVLFAVDRSLEARIWHRKAKQIYEDLPENKMKHQFDQTIQLSEAEAYYQAGDPDKALKKVAWISCKSKRQLLDAALLAAKCHIALEEPEKAREKLQYVADQGNKLHIVEEAKALLEAMPS